MSFWLIVVSFFLIFYIHHLWFTYSYWKIRGVVGPTPWPIVGNYGPVLFRLKQEKQFIEEIYYKYNDKGFVGFFIGTKPVLLIIDPQIVKEVLVTDFEEFPDRCISSGIGNFRKSLFTALGNGCWKFMKNKISPLFNTTNTFKFAPKIEAAAEMYVKFVGKKIEKNMEQNISELKRQYVLEVISTVLFGTNLDKLKGNEAVDEYCFKLVKFETFEIVRILDHIFPFMFKIFNPLSNFFITKFKDYFGGIIHFVMKESKCKLDRRVDNESITYLNDLLELKEKCKQSDFMIIDDDMVVQNMSNFAVTTMQTTKMAMTYLAYHMATNRKIQEKCYEEITKVSMKYEGEYNRDALSEMKYLKMVIEESLRLHPNTYLMDRICASKYQFRGMNMTIDKGVLVYIPVDCLQMDAKYFPDPEKFIPERFAYGNRDKITPFSYLPFGEGPRSCPGKQLVNVMMLIGMAKFLKTFQLVPTENTPQNLQYSSSLRIKHVIGDILVDIRRRNGQ